MVLAFASIHPPAIWRDRLRLQGHGCIGGFDGWGGMDPAHRLGGWNGLSIRTGSRSLRSHHEGPASSRMASSSRAERKLNPRARRVLTPDFRIAFTFLALGLYFNKIAKCSPAGFAATSLGIFLVLQTSRLRFRFSSDRSEVTASLPIATHQWPPVHKGKGGRLTS